MSTGCAAKGHQGKSFLKGNPVGYPAKAFFSFDGPLALGTSLFAKKSWSEEGENFFASLPDIRIVDRLER